MRINFKSPIDKLSVSALIILISFQGYTQLKEFEFGNFSLNELQMESYDKDSEAEAVILYDQGTTEFIRSAQGGYVMRFRHAKKIKILNKDGLDWANVSIRFYDSKEGKEEISRIEAYSYSIGPHGGVEKKTIDKSMIYDERINEFWSLKKFAIPGVREGSIIEFRYQKDSHFIFHIEDWDFQSTIPTQYSSYVLKAIPFYEYIFIVQGIKEFDYENKYVSKQLPRKLGEIEFQDMVYEMAMEDVPAFRDQSFITSIDDYIIGIDFQLAKTTGYYGGEKEYLTTWPKMIEDYKHKEIGIYLKKAEKLGKKELPSLGIDLSAEVETKARMIIEHVKKNYSFNGIYGVWPQHSAPEFIKKKNGNVADLNYILTGYLRAAGVDAYPIMLSTRNHGKIKYQYPFSQFINYANVFINTPKTSFIADATEPMLAYDEYPIRCMNEYGFLYKEGKEARWVPLTPVEASSNTISLSHEWIHENDKISSQGVVYLSKYEAYRMRKQLNENENYLREMYSNQNLEIDNVKTYNRKKFNEKLKFTFEAKFNPTIIGETIYIQPFLNFVDQSNPLKQEKRDYPVDMIYPVRHVLSAQIKIPEGYQLKKQPDEFAIDNELLQMSKQVKGYKHVISVTCQYQFKKTVFQPDEYPKLKTSYQQLVDHLNQRIAIIRIE